VIADRLGALALEADMDGIAAWKAIAVRLQALRQQPREPS
jgi:hypothetical protein